MRAIVVGALLLKPHVVVILWCGIGAVADIACALERSTAERFAPDIEADDAEAMAEALFDTDLHAVVVKVLSAFNDGRAAQVFLSSDGCARACCAGAKRLSEVGAAAVEVACGVAGRRSRVEDGSVLVDDEGEFAVKRAHIVDAEREVSGELLDAEVDLVVIGPAESLLRKCKCRRSDVAGICLVVIVGEGRDANGRGWIGGIGKVGRIGGVESLHASHMSESIGETNREGLKVLRQLPHVSGWC